MEAFSTCNNASKISSFWSCVVLSVTLSFVSPSLQAQDANNRPNILSIGIDDYNDWAGILETHPQVVTPNIDRLAERGTLLTNAKVQAPVCNPSCVRLMTGGLRPTTTGIYGLAPGHREAESTQDVVKLPQYFAEHGYRTYSMGKIFHVASRKVKKFLFPSVE